MRALGLRSTLGRDQTCVTDCVRPVCVSALLCRLHSKRQFGLNACGVPSATGTNPSAHTAHYTHHTQSPARWRSGPQRLLYNLVFGFTLAQKRTLLYI